MELYTDKYSKTVGGARGYAGYRNRIRLKVLTNRIPVTPKDNILEIGPNTCLLMDAFKSKAGCVTGIDINEEAVKNSGRSDLVCMNASAMKFESESFTKIVAIEVFEHIPDLRQVFFEIGRVLTAEGKCYMTVPFELFRGQQALGDAWFVYRDLKMARKLHVHKLNPKKINQMIVGSGLKVESSELIWIPGPSYFIVVKKGG